MSTPLRQSRQGAGLSANRVTALTPRPRTAGATTRGDIIAEHVVNAAGLWAREVGALAGVYLPLHPMEHQYLVTDDPAEIWLNLPKSRRSLIRPARPI